VSFGSASTRGLSRRSHVLPSAVAGDGRGHLPAGWQMLVTGDTATACFAMKRVDLDAAPTLPYHLPGSGMSGMAIQML
jgi:hypothetical protein